jgi:pyruvate carboxylase
MLVKALKDAVDVPLHLHMHDTSGNSIASYMAAVEAGVDVIDGAVSSMAGHDRRSRRCRRWRSRWRARRAIPASTRTTSSSCPLLGAGASYYAPFESGLAAPPPTSTSTRSRAASTRTCGRRPRRWAFKVDGGWDAVKRAYADVNRLFGDIPKVTPSSKVVGDMAIWMVKQGLDARSVTERAHELTFPESVIDFMRGGSGGRRAASPSRCDEDPQGRDDHRGAAGREHAALRLGGAKREMEQLAGVEVARRDVVSYALYPKVMREYMEHRALHGDTSVLPTPTFFYGLRVGEEAWIDIEPGKTLIVKLLSIGEIEPDGARVLTFEINGQSRQMRVADDAAKVSGPKRRRATPTSRARSARRCRAG